MTLEKLNYRLRVYSLHALNYDNAKQNKWLKKKFSEYALSQCD